VPHALAETITSPTESEEAAAIRADALRAEAWAGEPFLRAEDDPAVVLAPGTARSTPPSRSAPSTPDRRLKATAAEQLKAELEVSREAQAKELKEIENLEAQRTLLEVTAREHAESEAQLLSELKSLRTRLEQDRQAWSEKELNLNSQIEDLRKVETTQLERAEGVEAKTKRRGTKAVAKSTTKKARPVRTVDHSTQQVVPSKAIPNEIALEVKQVSKPAEAEQTQLEVRPNEVEVEALHPLETWQFPLSNELAAGNGLEEPSQPLEVIAEMVSPAQANDETSLEAELQEELSRLEAAASLPETGTEDEAKLTSPAPNEKVSGDKSKVSLLVKSLKSSDPVKRSKAIQKLAQLGEDEAFNLITELFDDKSTEVRNTAALALYKMKPDCAASFTRAFREAGIERRRHIAAAFNGSGLAAQAIQSLTGADRDKTYDAFSLLFLMAKAGEVEILLQTIERHPDTSVQLSVVKLLAFCNQPEIIPAFRNLAIRGALPTEVRSAVMEAIYQISSNARENSLSVA